MIGVLKCYYSYIPINCFFLPFLITKTLPSIAIDLSITIFSSVYFSLFIDIALAVIPFIPALSGARHLNKADDVVDLTKTYGHIDDFADAGGTIRKAKKADFFDNGWDLIGGLKKQRMDLQFLIN